LTGWTWRRRPTLAPFSRQWTVAPRWRKIISTARSAIGALDPIERITGGH
jgi:hypothetical protein